MKFTKEQESILYCNDSEIYVNAKAGTGKTTTLIEFTKKRPADIFLYLVYNKKNKIEAQKKFIQGNVEVQTIHSLAYKHIGKRYKHKLGGNIKIFEIIKNTTLKKEYEKNKQNSEIFIEASKVIECLEYYFNKDILDLEDSAGIFSNKTIELAYEYLDQMFDENNENVKMTHNGYLKLFQLQQPQLDYDYILVDEAQDSNEIMLSIVKDSPAKKIFVGDNYQSIYGFRHNVNVFDLNESATELFLTKSFRFGKNIAYYANKLNEIYRNNYIEIQGNEKITDFVFDSPGGRNFTNMQYTVLTRTNAHLFDLAARYSLLGKKIFIVGEQEIFQELIDAMYLFKGELHKIKNANILEYKNFERLKQISQTANDPELKFLVKVVEQYQENIPTVITRIKNQTTKEIYADFVLSTAHKSKGLEWHNVILATDFPKLINKKGEIKSLEEIDIEEINLLYVAITRAIERLYLNEVVGDFFNKVL